MEFTPWIHPCAPTSLIFIKILLRSSLRVSCISQVNHCAGITRSEYNSSLYVIYIQHSVAALLKKATMYMRNVLILSSFMLAVFAIFVVNAQTTLQPEPEATPSAEPGGNAEPEATVTSEPEMTTASGSVSYSGSLFFITGCILNTLLVKTL
ncbi:uncharacterized protein [Antedon mediterranea]|uniref:uncharacterized protein n=1 Tax=Antedon mediterranea TaxID=105859 RepID=UPI003AF92E61